MRVFHFNAYSQGGAAIAVKRIVEATRTFVPETFIYTISPVKSSDLYRQMPAFDPKGRVNKLENFIRWRLYYQYIHKYTAGKLEQYEKFSTTKLPVRTVLPINQGVPDIVHLHWISEMIDYPSFFKSLPEKIPVVWTLHDMNPFTGGCHYALGCYKFTTRCGKCPQINGNKEHDITTDIQAEKATILSKLNLHAVANSRWLEHQARKSTILADTRSFQVIHNPINTTSDFEPHDKQMCKQILGLPDRVKVIAFGADNINTPRKGFYQLLEALKTLRVQQKDIVCLVFGGGVVPDDEELLPNMIYTGYIASPRLQSIIYSAADVFVIPSLQEAFGQTAVEAMACGTPVIGYANTGVKDIITDGKTGFFAKQGDINDLAAKISQVINNDGLMAKMGEDARTFAVENFSYEKQGAKYAQFYANILR